MNKQTELQTVLTIINKLDLCKKPYDLPKPMQEEIGDIHRTIFIKEFESIINNFPNQKAPDPDEFTGKFHKTFILIFYNHFLKIKAEERLSNSFCEANVTLMPKSKILQRRKATDQYLKQT